MIRWPDEVRGPWGVRANWVMVNGRPECVGLVIWHGADQGTNSPMEYQPHAQDALKPITATGIAELPIATIIDRLRRAARDHWRENQADLRRLFPHWEPDDPRLEPVEDFEEAEARPGAPRRYDRAHYLEVAQTYLKAWQEEGNPTQAVADHFGVSRSAAAKWVAKARSAELQLLSPAAHGKSGAAPGSGMSEEELRAVVEPQPRRRQSKGRQS